MRGLLIIFRVFLLMALIFLALRPVISRPRFSLHPKTAVFIDQSKSMAVKDPEERLKHALKFASALAQRYSDAKFFAFSKNVREISAKDIQKIEAVGDQTNIAGAIQRVLADKNFQRGIVLSDGRQVGPGDPVVAAASLGTPLILIGMGNSSFYKDVAVRSIQAPPFAFKNISTSLTANISAVGFPGKRISIRLKEGSRLIGLQTIQINSPDMETTVNFPWVPSSLGSKYLTVEADELQGEVTFQNNRKTFSLDIGRDRFRVLYICGQPGWEYSFLRHQFKSDPAVELVTFVILRNPGNIINVPDAELALIPFPTQEDLMRQMSSFDLIVFEEFIYTQYGLSPGLFQSVRQKVKNGGSLLILGGPQTFSPGSPYSFSEIQEMLPFRFDNTPIQYSGEKFQFHPRNYSHPILRLDPNPDENIKIWSNLPLLEGLTVGPQLKEGSSALAVSDYHGKEVPVLAAMNFGEGRTAVMLSRTTWRWSMLEGRGENTQYAYQQFWKNMVLWLTGAEQFKTVRIAIEGKNIFLDDQGRGRIWVYDEYFKPISDVELKVLLTKPDGAQTQIFPDQETTGVYSFPIKADQLRTWKVQVWVYRKGKKFGSDSLEFKVLEGFQEEEDLRPNHDLLKEMAHASGGQFFHEEDFSIKLLEEFDAQSGSKTEEKILIWTSPWLLGFLLAVFIVEWIIRKRKGFL